MPVNANLLASIGQNMPSPMEGVDKAYRLKDLMNREQASTLGLEAAKSGAVQASKVAGIMQNADLSTSEGQMQTAAEVAKVDPKQGMDFMRTIQDLQKGKGELEAQRYKNLSEQNDILGNAAATLTMEHDALIQKGVPPAQAAAQMQPRYLQTIQNLVGAKLSDGAPVLDQQHKDILSANATFNPDAVRGWALQSNQARDALKVQLAFHGSERADAQAAESARHNAATEDAAAKAAAAKESANFTPEQGNLMAAIAEKGVSLPTGFRSKDQQRVLYQSLLERNPGRSVEEIADLIKTGKIELAAQTKEVTTAAGVAGKVQVFANELTQMAPLLRAASAKVPRGSFVPWNKLMQMGESSISDPNLKQLKSYITSTINAYNALGSRGGMDAETRAHNREVLMSADSPEAFDAALGAIENEAKVALSSAVEATKVPEFRGQPSTAPIQRARNPQTGEVVELKDGKWVKVGG